MAAKMEEGRGLMTRAHPEVHEYTNDIFRLYDQESENANETDDWRKLCQNIGSRFLEIEKRICLLEMRVVQATITLHKTTMRQLFANTILNPIDKLPALMINIQAALGIRPVGMQGCVIQGSGGLRIQGVQGKRRLFIYICGNHMLRVYEIICTFTGTKEFSDLRPWQEKKFRLQLSCWPNRSKM